MELEEVRGTWGEWRARPWRGDLLVAMRERLVAELTTAVAAALG